MDFRASSFNGYAEIGTANGLTSIDLDTFNASSFAGYQRRRANADLSRLVFACRDRFRYALELLSPASRGVDALGQSRSYPLVRILYRWDRFCVAYRIAQFDPQTDLLEPHYDREERRWSQFVDHHCIRPFTERAVWMRSLLEGVEAIEPLPQSTSLPVEEVFAAIIYNIEGVNYD
jgi:hypothetical protein